MSDEHLDWDSAAQARFEQASIGDVWTWSDVPSWSGEWPNQRNTDRYIRSTELARGGMGSVYLAEDTLLRRQVALKITRSSNDSIEARQLLREARITAALRHPGIPQILDAGVDPNGSPWFAMSIAPGRTLQSLLRATGVTPHQALRALAEAADILGYAHKRGMLHRDVKPENIMVSTTGSVVVLDWGIACPKTASTDWDALLTGTRSSADELLGTPAYMSPEQVLGETLTTQTDVWGLGVCMVEILDGAPPFGTVDQQSTLRAVVQARVPTMASPYDTLVQRALARNPHDRPADGHAFARELRALLGTHDTVADRPPATPAAPPRRRWPAAATAAAVGLVLGAAVTALVTRRAATSDPSDLLASTMAMVVQDATRNFDPSMAQLTSIAGLEAAPQRADVFRGTLASQPLALQSVERRPLHGCEEPILSLDATTLGCIHPESVSMLELPSLELRWQKPIKADSLSWVGENLLVRQLPGGHLGILDNQQGAVISADNGALGEANFLPSHHADRVLLTIGPQVLSVLNPLTTEVVPLTMLEGTCVGRIRPDRSIVAGCPAGLSILDGDNQPVSSIARSAPVSGSDVPFKAALSRSGRWFAEGSLAGSVRIFDLETKQESSMVRLWDGMIRSLDIAPDGQWVAAVDEQGHAWVWPTQNPGARVQLPGKVKRVQFPDDQRLWTISDQFEVWALPDSALPGVLNAAAGVASVDWNGPWIAAAAGSGRVWRWNIETGERHDFEVVEDLVVKDVAMAPSGAAAALSLDRSAFSEWIWATEPMPAFPAQIGRRMVWNNDRGLLSVGFQSGPQVVDATGKVWDNLARPSSKYLDLEPTADHTGSVLIDDKGTILRFKWDPDPTMETHAVHVGGHAVAMAAPGSALVAVADATGVSIWTQNASEAQLHWDTPTTPIDVAISADEQWVAAGLMDGDIWVWDTATGQRVAKLLGHTERVSSVWFSADATQLLSGSWDETLRMWHLSALHEPIETLTRDVEARWGRSRHELFDDIDDIDEPAFPSGAP